jgi:hypothetical protein
MRGMFILTAAVAASIATSSFAQCGSSGSCLSPHGTPGCDNVECCEIVCGLDPFCCENQWDSLCVGEAEDFCFCGAPESGSCLSAHGTPWCDDGTCCSVVCGQDAFCCSVQWDSICAGQAQSLCFCGAPESGECLAAHGTPWCNDDDCCSAVCASDAFCCSSAWDSICAGEAASLCVPCGSVGSGSCYETGLPGCNDATCCAVVCEEDPFCCETEWDGLCVNEALDMCGCAAPLTGSCASSHGTPWCNDGDCCNAVCAVDAFCCSTAWDGLCVSEAQTICYQCGGAGAGSCFAEGEVACNDLDCCNLVCGQDAFCCSTEWDSLCVDEAIDLCLPCGGSGKGSCFVPHSGVGCNNEACCVLVCTNDPFCCNVAWDGVCANAAVANCVGACTGDLDGNGAVGPTDLGILLGAWGTPGGDLNGDGTTNPQDLGILLGAWGPCP